MRTTQIQDSAKGQAETKDNQPNAFARLVSLPKGTDKNTLISTIDSAVTLVLSDLSNHETGNLPPDVLLKVQTSLTFLEQCLSFNDKEFITFAKKRANEVQNALNNTLKRIEQAKTKPPVIEPTTAPLPEVKLDKKPDPIPAEITGPKGFIYVREEKILIDYAFKQMCNRLSFLRDDKITVVNKKQVIESGIFDDGVPPFFILSPQFPDILRPALEDLIKEKRDLFSRRIYIHTHKDDPDVGVYTLYEENHARDISGIIALGFDSWAGELSKAGIAGLPQEQRVIGPKTIAKDEGIGSSLKKVFSFGKKDTKAAPTKATPSVVVPDTNPIRIHKEWEILEMKGVFDLSQHFSFSLLSYIMSVNEKQFETECECIRQIVDQQDTPDVGPVISNLSRLYKFYDNIFFDLVILVLFHRKNKFDINMLQAACMSQNFVVDRLPLTMDELRRRPLEHAKHVLAVLNEGADKKTVKSAIEAYMHVHQTIHASKVGKRIAASENLFKRQVEKLEDPSKKVVQGILDIFIEVNTLKHRQEEDGVFLGEEILEAIETGINQAVAHL
jgi:hypothetical protein